MPPIHLILVVAAFLLALLAAFWDPRSAAPPSRFPHPGWLAIACLALAEVVP